MSDNMKRGVGGWLVLLIVGMIVIAPFTSLTETSKYFHQAEANYVSLAANAKWHRFKTLTWIVQITTSIYVAYSGYLLLAKLSYSSVRNAKYALWIAGPVSTMAVAFLLPYVFYGSKAVDQTSVLTALVSTITAVVWTTYLVRSKRVSATYSAQHSNSASVAPLKPKQPETTPNQAL
jgi:hypothetical protein